MTPDSMRDGGPSGSRPEEQTDEPSFVNRLAHELHACMHKTLEARVVRTVAKDLSNPPQAAIEAALSD